jgi:hypothetical protein
MSYDPNPHRPHPLYHNCVSLVIAVILIAVIGLAIYGVIAL